MQRILEVRVHCIGLYRSKITNNDPKMFSKGEIEIPHERGRTMSLTEVLIQMGYLKINNEKN